MTTTYGRDVSCADRIDTNRIVSGSVLLAEAIYRRLTTVRGSLEDDQTYGMHIAHYLNRAMSAAEIAAIPGVVRTEVLKDERIEEVDIEVSQDGTQIRLDISGSGYEGVTFRLALAVADVTVELLEVA